ncbi:capsule assembly Wzi family protein [Christiangramia fulva]|uniref:capsule assembly Wzi family protein n=1 Tax=Christiangramia fulva TaxID=2126553 RepID=UPI00131AC0C1|nr:capsule assembly Wzi family protein [Christiangramia fulva]
MEVSGAIGTSAFVSSKPELTFWFYSNKEGIIDKNSDFLLYSSLGVDYYTYSGFSIEAKANLAYNNSQDEIIPHELYLRLYNEFYELNFGRIRRRNFFNGISATNQNIIWSNNALPLWGVSFNSLRTIYLTEKFGFEFEWSESFLDDPRWVKNSFVHHKVLSLVYGSIEDFQVKLGINHYAQWGGTSISEGEQPASFEDDYLRIVFALPGGRDSNETEQHIALGNHIGSYVLQVSKHYNDFDLNFTYNSIFEDRKGSRLGNFPDGRYGFHLSFAEERALVSDIHYDFLYTRNQSNHLNEAIASDYFNNDTFRSGWTYYNRILGAPFFDYSAKANRVVGNKFLTHHIGIAGSFSNYFVSYPYKLLISHVHKEGRYFNYYEPDRNELYLNYEMGLLQRPFNLSIQLGTEFSNVAEPIFGAGVRLEKRF